MQPPPAARGHRLPPLRWHGRRRHRPPPTTARGARAHRTRGLDCPNGGAWRRRRTCATAVGSGGGTALRIDPPRRHLHPTMGPDGSRTPTAMPSFDDADAALVGLGRTFVALVQPSTRIVRTLPSCTEIVGLPPAKLVGRPLAGLLPEGEPRRRFRATIDRVARSGERARLEHDLMWAGGRRRCLAHLTPVVVAGERLVHVSCTDVSHLSVARGIFEGQAALLGTLFAHVDEAVAGLSASGTVLALSDRAATILGVPREEALGRPFDRLLGCAPTLPDETAATVEIERRGPAGTTERLRLRFRRLSVGDDRVFAVGIEPLLPETESYERLVHLARTDPLTGVRNRSDVIAEMSRWIATTPDRPFYVAYVDLDGFKTVNDRFGHAAGDAVLQQVGHALRASVRKQDAVGRIGGDEFVVALRDVSDPEVAVQLARRLAHAVEGLGRKDETAAIRASVGVARYPDDGRTVEALLDRADAAMYAAKRDGGGKVVVTWTEPVPPLRSLP
ncbi:MAG: diguanylate cyclase [Deltaproteobacteria bacterium]|nr:MAG: diguanylate cyclase [Deltaproteobacteria bacterium]